MASRTTSEKYITANLAGQQVTLVAPTAIAAVTVTDSYLTIDTPSAPGPL